MFYIQEIMNHILLTIITMVYDDYKIEREWQREKIKIFIMYKYLLYRFF